MMNVVFLGPPGSGKGTQAQVIAKEFGIQKLSTGDILRQVLSDGSQLSKQLSEIMNSGRFVSDDIVLKLVENKIKSDECAKGFILDGFPRNIIQAEMLDDILAKMGCSSLTVISFVLPDDEIIKRISGRFSCKACGASYHKYYKLPKIEGKCDHCGGVEFISREDDSEASVKTRLDIYRKQTFPLIKYYKDKGVLTELDAVRPIEYISSDIIATIMDGNHNQG